jgi:DNA recombination protein RmuC
MNYYTINLLIGLLLGLAIGSTLTAILTWAILRAKFTQENQTLKIRLAELQNQQATEVQKLKWLENAEAQMREAFEALASRTLQTNANDFMGRAQEQLTSLLNQARGDWGTQKAEIKGLVEPLQQNLNNINGYVRDLEQKREGAYQGMTEQLRQITNAHQELQKTTLTLTQALKSSTVRGRWGEMQLHRVAEMSGMVEHISFDEQTSTEDGRPDMTVYLPNGGVIPVDSKAPMEAYFEAVSTNDEQVRRNKFTEHVKAMQSRIRELNQKQYWEQFEKAPEFVVMFIPSESCLSAAFDNDPELMEYAITRKVMITTPITLLALLKAVAYGWQQHQTTENARLIASEAKEFYKRLDTFVGHLNGVGNSLNKTVKEYNTAISSMEHRLFPSVRRLEGLGVASTELAIPEAVNVSGKLIEMSRE